MIKRLACNLCEFRKRVMLAFNDAHCFDLSLCCLDRWTLLPLPPSSLSFQLKSLLLPQSEIIRLKQVEHIKSECKILAMVQHPFIVNM